MVDYLQIAKRARKQELRGTPVADVRAADREARKLLVAGWKPKERGGLVIWLNPETGFYYSQEVALHRLKI